ncbi:oligomeric golgi complex component, COG2-domain-containing protein [Collybia nuda]|uniref:Conserved oligomeric Golgi complex subunit 2 n=1 Tax=Collybia nuda TaxID=64659 RepID=A0A9P5YCB7_9AGAR|nr:oligomeric golgi complex component, COG2-domain-containing protein [Collybia nuda]
MSVQSPTHDAHTFKDPFQLDRLAEELATRETIRPLRQQRDHNDDEDDSQVPDLPAHVPLSHDNKFLIAKDFDVEEFLLSRSHDTSLSDLRMELRDYLSHLKEELVKLINDDYEAFISLSTDLRDEGARLNRLNLPLGEFKVQVLDSRSQLQIIQNAIQDKLEKRSNLREEKALLHLLLKLSESVTRLESLLLIALPEKKADESSEIGVLAHPSHTEVSAEDRSRGNTAKHLGRVAAEYTQLLYHASKARAEKCIFVDEIQWRIDRIQKTLSSDLDHVFAITLVALTDGKDEGRPADVEKSKWIADLTECLRTYDMLGLWRDAEDVLRREVVRNFVKKSIYPEALAAPHSPIIPHTPLPPAKASGFLTTSLPPRTPYTPFTAFVHSERPATYSIGTIISSPYARILEDTEDPLARLYTHILRFVERDLSRVMDIAEKVSLKSSLHSRSEKELNSSQSLTSLIVLDGDGFEIMANVIWEEVGRAVMDELGATVFAAGRPSEFRKHHEISQAFIRSLEYLAPSAHSVEVMRRHSVYSAFEQRWQLPVYFQMRWKEIIGKLEESLSVVRIEPTLPFEKNSFSMGQSLSVWVAITACWSAEIFIPNLCHRFWRLTLQILSRYKTWLDQSLPPSEVSPTKISTTFSTEKNLTSPTLSRAPTPIPVVESSSAESTASDDSILRQYAAVIVDLEAMRTNVLTIWREEISPMLPEMADTNTDSVKAPEALQHSLSELASLTPPLANQIVAILIKRCCEALLPVRSIPSQFRAMSNKRSPSEPSYFVSSILRPIKVFFGIGVGEAPGLLLSEDYLVPYAKEIFESVCQRYIYYLSAMKKTEESLRRLKKGKKTTFSLFGSSNTGKDDDGRDEERIRTQMIYDVNAFGKDAESLGVLLQMSESFKALVDMVNAIEAEAS